MSVEEAEKFASDFGMFYIETSARSGANIEQVFDGRRKRVDFREAGGGDNGQDRGRENRRHARCVRRAARDRYGHHHAEGFKTAIGDTEPGNQGRRMRVLIPD